MIEINLLPKQYNKKAANLSFGKAGFYTLGGVVGIIIMLAFISFYQAHQISKLDENIGKAKQRAAMLQNDIRLVDALIDVKQKIGERMSAVDRLDSHRTAWVRVLENISSNVPEFIWLARLSEKDAPAVKNAETEQEQQAPQVIDNQPRVHEAEIEGYAFTLNALASFMINMMRSDYFDNVELTTSSEKVFGEQKAYNFVFSCNVHYLSDEELQNLIAQANNNNEDNNKTSHKSLN